MDLTQLKIGQLARITSLDDNNPNLHRLCEMGLIPGEEISLIQKAPLGEPIKVKIMNYELCLRKQDALGVRVELLDS